MVGGVVVVGARVEHLHVGMGVEQILQFLGVYRRRVIGMLDEFPEGFAGHVDAAEYRQAGLGPALEPVLQGGNVRIAEGGQPLACLLVQHRVGA